MLLGSFKMWRDVYCSRYSSQSSYRSTSVFSLFFSFIYLFIFWGSNKANWSSHNVTSSVIFLSTALPKQLRQQLCGPLFVDNNIPRPLYSYWQTSAEFCQCQLIKKSWPGDLSQSEMEKCFEGKIMIISLSFYCRARHLMTTPLSSRCRTGSLRK